MNPGLRSEREHPIAGDACCVHTACQFAEPPELTTLGEFDEDSQEQGAWAQKDMAQARSAYAWRHRRPGNDAGKVKRDMQEDMRSQPQFGPHGAVRKSIQVGSNGGLHRASYRRVNRNCRRLPPPIEFRGEFSDERLEPVALGHRH
jgi:hypothetical protein